MQIFVAHRLPHFGRPKRASSALFCVFASALGLAAFPLAGCTTQVPAASESTTAAVEARSEPTTRAIGDAIIDRLDLTSFDNSVGPRREANKRTFSDYGFTMVERTEKGARLYRQEGGWMMGFDVLSASPTSVQLCFVDSALMRPGDIGRPSYDARSALLVSRGESAYWSARQVPEGFPGCSNNPPATS
jgi:hypothetical protein